MNEISNFKMILVFETKVLVTSSKTKPRSDFFQGKNPESNFIMETRLILASEPYAFMNERIYVLFVCACLLFAQIVNVAMLRKKWSKKRRSE